MMAAAARESHRSPSAEKGLLSPPGRASLNSEEGGARSSIAETNDEESIVDGGRAAGVAGLEADVGNTDVFFDAAASQQQRGLQAKKLSKHGRGGGSRKNKSRSRGRPSATATTAAAATTSTEGGSKGASIAATATVETVHAVTSEKVGNRVGAKDAAAMNAAKKTPTRERSQQMYETYRQTQVGEGDKHSLRQRSCKPPSPV